MLIVKVGKKESIERALKRLKRKVINTKQVKQLRDRQQYIKPSETRRKQKQKAVYIQKKRDEEQNY